MKKYIKNLVKLVNYERDAEINLMINEIKKLTPYKRETLGRAINKVKGKNLGKQLGFHIIKFGRKTKIKTEISVGDIVLISIANPLKSDLTGTVTEKGNRYIKVALENVPKWALKKNVRIDLYANDITYKRMQDNLNNLSYKGKNALEYILTPRQPQKGELSILNSTLDYYDKGLNDSQKNAVKQSLATPNFFLIHGPFGTGKTRTLIELINQEYKKEKKILITSESNNAVDNILEILSQKNNKIKLTRLGHPQRVSKENIKFTLAYQIDHHPLNSKIQILREKQEKIIEKRDKHTKPVPSLKRGYSDKEIYKLGTQRKGGRGISSAVMISMARWISENQQVNTIIEEIKKIEEKIVEEIINESDAILSTNSSAAMKEIKNIVFDVAIIDEASQATIPSVLIPIAKAEKFILAGDHKQLPPTIISSKAQKLSDTLFEQLITQYPSKSILLDTQYRMNNILMEFPNQEFYNSKIKSASNVNDIILSDILKTEHLSEIAETDMEDQLLSNQNAIVMIDTSNMENNREKQLKDSKSIINITESKITASVVNFYQKLGVKKKDIGIITPYADQVNYIKNITNVEVNTVDGFQGREKEIIIISTVRSNKNDKIGFLKDLRRLNVSLTRAKRKIIIIGNQKTLKSDPTYKRMINYIQNTNALIQI